MNNAARLTRRPKRRVPLNVTIRQILRLPPVPQATGINGEVPNSSADNLGVPLTSAATSPTGGVPNPTKRKKKKKGPNMLIIVGVVIGGLALVFMLKKKRGLAGYIDDAKRRAKGFIDKA